MSRPGRAKGRWPTVEFQDYLKALVAMLAVVNPLSISPVFLSITAHQGAAQRRRTALGAALAVTVILIVTALLGDWVLKAFSIGVHSFSVGGGVLLMMTAIAMLQAKEDPTRRRMDESEDSTERSVTVVPLALPLLAGPGSLTTVIIYTQQDTGVAHRLGLCGVVVVVGVVCAGVLIAATGLGRLIGRVGINVATRVMGIILAAIAVEFITLGLRGLLPGLAG